MALRSSVARTGHKLASIVSRTHSFVVILDFTTDWLKRCQKRMWVGYGNKELMNDKKLTC